MCCESCAFFVFFSSNILTRLDFCSSLQQNEPIRFGHEPQRWLGSSWLSSYKPGIWESVSRPKLVPAVEDQTKLFWVRYNYEEVDDTVLVQISCIAGFIWVMQSLPVRLKANELVHLSRQVYILLRGCDRKLFVKSHVVKKKKWNVIRNRRNNPQSSHLSAVFTHEFSWRA